MRRITLTIDQLILKGFEAGSQRALAEGLKAELSRVLADNAGSTAWTRSRRTPVLRLGRVPLEPGPSGGKSFGVILGRSIGKGLKQ